MNTPESVWNTHFKRIYNKLTFSLSVFFFFFLQKRPVVFVCMNIFTSALSVSCHIYYIPVTSAPAWAAHLLVTYCSDPNLPWPHSLPYIHITTNSPCGLTGECEKKKKREISSLWGWFSDKCSLELVYNICHLNNQHFLGNCYVYKHNSAEWVIDAWRGGSEKEN